MKRLPAAVTALLVALAGTPAVIVGAPTSASAAAPTSECRGSDPNLRNGYCHQFPNGAVTWLGSFTEPSGRVFFCIDKNLDSRIPADAPTVSTANLRNQFGRSIGAAEVSALNYVITTWGRGAGNTDAAAIALIIREVMSDTGGQFPSGLKVGQGVKDISGGLPRSILNRAGAMWRTATTDRGPWTVRLTGSTSSLKVGASRTFGVSVLSAAGRRMRATVALTATNATAPARVRTRAGGSTTFTVTARRPGTLTVTGTVSGPAQNGRLLDPPRAGVQRGWIAELSRSSSSLRLRALIAKAQPALTTRTSAAQVEAGVAFHDTVRVTGLPAGTALTGTAHLYGPFASAPTSTSCTAPALAGSVTFAVRGNGTYTTGSLTRTALGYYTWVASLPATTTTTEGITHPCGMAVETTKVVKPRIDVRVSTQVSA